MKYLKKYFKYIFIFFMVLLFLNCIPFDLDEVWNYGFMHNIYSGLVPYKDFNMVVTPFFPFLFSLPFHIFGSNLIVVNICQSLLMTFVYVLLEKLFSRKADVFFILLFFNYDMLYASYNFFIMFLFLLLLYMEKKNCNDYLIGFIIGLAVLTKQSVGGALALVSLYYLFKDYRKFFKRVLGALIPATIFIIYIFVMDCYKEFFDLCIAGLFDFGKENYVGYKFIMIIFFVCLGVVLFQIYKDRKDINKYYVLALSVMVIPMFDYFHLKFFVLGVLILFIDKIPIKMLNLNLLFYGSMTGMGLLNFFMVVERPIIYPNNVNHFEYRFIADRFTDETKLVSDKLTSFGDKEVIYLFEQAYYYKIVNDIDINYFDLINTGNWGYNGSEKLLNALEEKEDAIFVINRLSYARDKQTDRVALEFVGKYCVKIDEVLNYEFYEIKKSKKN